MRIKFETSLTAEKGNFDSQAVHHHKIYEMLFKSYNKLSKKN